MFFTNLKDGMGLDEVIGWLLAEMQAPRRRDAGPLIDHHEHEHH